MEGKISITRPSFHDGREVIAIEIYDTASRTTFCKMQIGMADFAAALTGQSQVPAQIEVRGLANVGLLKVSESRTATVSGRFHDRKFLQQWLTENCQEDGWVIDSYLGSQRSITWSDENTILNYSVHKFVPE